MFVFLRGLLKGAKKVFPSILVMEAVTSVCFPVMFFFGDR